MRTCLSFKPTANQLAQIQWITETPALGIWPLNCRVFFGWWFVVPPLDQVQWAFTDGLLPAQMDGAGKPQGSARFRSQENYRGLNDGKVAGYHSIRTISDSGSITLYFSARHGMVSERPVHGDVAGNSYRPGGSLGSEREDCGDQ